MQVSERFRRGVVVPLDDAAVDALEAQDVGEAIRVHFIEIEDQAEFEVLWNTGVFEAINESTGCLVDDYEEVAIPAEMIPRLRAVIESFKEERVGGATAARFFAALLEACDRAQRAAKPVYFVL